MNRLALTMYIKNRRNSNKFKACGWYQTLRLTESVLLRNRPTNLRLQRGFKPTPTNKI